MEQTFGTVIKARRRSITLTGFWTGVQCKEPPAARSRINGWNDGMSRRLRNYIENYRENFSVLGTLTYPAEFPRDGQIVKGHWRAFIERLRRTGWLKTNSLVWVMEFQERGAPHFHFVATAFLPKEWVAHNWAEITKGDHRSCSRMETIRCPDSAGAYLAKYLGKDEQKLTPEGFENVGRMWGVSGPRIVAGCPRVPGVVAVKPEALPGHFWGRMRKCEAEFGVRMAETLNGSVLYGTEEAIERSWRYLQESIAPIVLDGVFPAGSALRTAGESLCTLATKDTVIKKYVTPS